MSIHQATVKAVPSGDTLVLVGKPSASGPPQEMTLTLASIQAPRIGRGPQQSDEEAFAFESREFLRKLCIGKPVAFCILHSVSSIKKHFGDVDLIDTASGATVPLVKAVVGAGWAIVKESKEGKDSVHHADLVVLEKIAKENKLGVFTSDAAVLSKSIRKPLWAPTASDIASIFGKFENKPVKSIVEYVRDGASFRIYVVEVQAYISFSLSGVLAPRQGGGAKASEDEVDSSSEPFYLQSKLFTELRMLGREVDVVMEALDPKTNVIFGSILHPRGSISLELVRNGLAKLSSDRSGLKSDFALALLKAEQEAKANKKFIWEDYTEPRAAVLKGPRMFTGTCIEVVSGDTILVAPDEPTVVKTLGPEVRVCLSHIRAPRVGLRGTKSTSEFAPWSIDSREFVRSKIIGKKVSVTIDYEKSSSGPTKRSAKPSSKEDNADGDHDEDADSPASGRVYGTVQSLQDGASLGMLVISEGLAQCARVRKDDPRSADYDSLQIEEAVAATKKKGMHSANTTGPLTAKYAAANDVSTDGKNAKTVFGLLPKGTLSAIVEYVYTGSRVRVYVPSESCILQLSLGQVRSPLLARSSAGQPARAAEPFSDESRQFTRLQLVQRQVEIVCDDIDKNGVVLGRLYTTIDHQRTSFAVTLLDAGLAKIDKFAIERFSDEGISALQEAQAAAKSCKQGIWSLPSTEDDDADVSKEGEKLDAGTSSSTKSRWGLGGLVSVHVSEIVDGSTFYVNESDSLATLTSISEEIAAFVGSSAVGISPEFAKPGVLVAGIEPDGDSKAWNRVRIDEVDGATAYVTFIDYGSKNEIKLANLVALTGTSVGPRVLSTPPLARMCKLALVRSPPHPTDAATNDLYRSFSQSSAVHLHSLTWGRPLKALIVGLEKIDSREFSNKGKAGAQSAGFTSYVALYSDSYSLPTIDTPSSAFPAFASDESKAGSSEASTASSDSVSINEAMLSEGLATLSVKAVRAFRKGPRKGSGLALLTSAVSEDLIQRLEAAEATVRRNHLNLYKHGDPIGDSDDDFGEPHGFTRKGRDGAPSGKQVGGSTVPAAGSLSTNPALSKSTGGHSGKKK